MVTLGMSHEGSICLRWNEVRFMVTFMIDMGNTFGRGKNNLFLK